MCFTVNNNNVDYYFMFIKTCIENEKKVSNRYDIYNFDYKDSTKILLVVLFLYRFLLPFHLFS